MNFPHKNLPHNVELLQSQSEFEDRNSKPTGTIIGADFTGRLIELDLVENGMERVHARWSLTRGQNVIKGDRVEYELRQGSISEASSVSRIDPASCEK